MGERRVKDPGYEVGLEAETLMEERGGIVSVQASDPESKGKEEPPSKKNAPSIPQIKIEYEVDYPILRGLSANEIKLLL